MDDTGKIPLKNNIIVLPLCTCLDHLDPWIFLNSISIIMCALHLCSCGLLLIVCGFVKPFIKETDEFYQFVFLHMALSRETL